MLKLTEKRKESIISSENMEIGQIAKIVNCEYEHNNHIILKTFNSFVSLTDPKQTWQYGANFKVELLRNGTTFVVIDNE